MAASSLPVSPGTSRRAAAAFTLVELLAGLGILALMIVFMGQALNQTSKLWSIGQANTDRAQNIRALNDAIAGELRTALLPLDRTSRTGCQFVVNPTTITGAIFNNPTSVFWQGPCATDTTQGEAAEIGYFVQWNTVAHPTDPGTNAQNPQAMLCRFFVNPGSAAGADPNYLIYSTPASWLSDALVEAVAPATATQSYQGLFAENVVGLWVRCLDNAGQPIVKTFAGTAYTGNAYDSRLGYTTAAGIRSPAYTSAGSPPAPLCALPPAVEVSLVMLDAGVAAQVTPGIQASIQALQAQFAATPQARNGRDFVQAALVPANGLQTIAAGLRSSETRIYLQSSL